MSVIGKRDGKTSGAASLNHEADLSDSELDGVVGGSGLSLSSLKKDFVDLGHHIESAAQTAVNDVSQNAHGLQSAASNAATAEKHGLSDVANTLKGAFFDEGNLLNDGAGHAKAGLQSEGNILARLGSLEAGALGHVGGAVEFPGHGPAVHPGHGGPAEFKGHGPAILPGHDGPDVEILRGVPSGHVNAPAGVSLDLHADGKPTLPPIPRVF